MRKAAKVELGCAKHFVMSLDDKAPLCAYSVRVSLSIPVFCSSGEKAEL